VVAFGIGGYEPGNPIERYARQFEAAYQAGIPNVPHAGEHAGPESVWSAIRLAHPVRIGHGVRSIEDPELVAYLRDQRIPLEVCPTSNIALKGYPALVEHPIQRLIDAGVVVTLNSDDPPMFNTTLTDEFLLTAEAFGWDSAMIETLTLNAVRAALLPEDRKATMEQRFKADFVRLRTQLGV
jgi:adenosine deaminase